MTSNPLPNAFRIRVDRPQAVPSVAARIAQLSGVARVNYAQDIVVKLLRITDVVERVGIGIIGILLFVAAIIISKYDSTDGFCQAPRDCHHAVGRCGRRCISRAPFIVEGLIDGLVGSALAVGVLSAARIELLPRLITAMPFFPIAHIVVNEHLIVLAAARCGRIARYLGILVLSGALSAHMSFLTLRSLRGSVALLGMCTLLGAPAVVQADIRDKIHAQQQHIHETHEQLEAQRGNFALRGDA